MSTENTDYLKTESLFSINETIAEEYFGSMLYPWELLEGLSDYIRSLGERLDPEKYEERQSGVWVARDAEVALTACLFAPLIIDKGAQIRHCAFIRGSVIIGRGAVVGNSTEVKNSVLFNQAQAPHYNYIGDSILGYKAHMGAGSVTSNLKSDRSPVIIKGGDIRIDTGRKKVGAMIADQVEVGCGSVLNPGTVIGRGSHIYPLSMVRGIVPAGSIYKNKNEIVRRRGEKCNIQ